MDAICLIWINAISIALLIIVLCVWQLLRRQFPAPLLFDLVAYFVVLKIIIIFLIPAVIRVVNDWRLDKAIGAMPIEIAINYTIEFASYSIWLLTIWIVTKLPSIKRVIHSSNGHYNLREISRKERDFYSSGHFALGAILSDQKANHRQAKLFMFLLIGSYLFYIFSKHSPLLGSIYLSKPVALLSVFFEWAVMMSVPVVAVYIFSLYRKSVGNFIYFLGAGVALISITYALASGSRGQIVGPALWLVFLYLFVSRKRIILLGAVAGIIFVLFLHSSIVDVRAIPKFGDKSPFEKIGAFFAGKKTGADQADLLNAMEFRFGEASRVSVAFLRLYDSGQEAGFKPIQSALWAPLPRRFFPGKPQPGSIDGSLGGTGMHVVQSYMRALPQVMSDFLSGVHAYWELGLPGVVIFSILSGIFVALCANYFAGFNLAGLPMMMMVLRPWWNEPKLWVSQIILEIVTVLIPMILIWYFSGLILVLWKRFKNHLSVIFKPYLMRKPI